MGDRGTGSGRYSATESSAGSSLASSVYNSGTSTMHVSQMDSELELQALQGSKIWRMGATDRDRLVAKHIGKTALEQETETWNVEDLIQNVHRTGSCDIDRIYRAVLPQMVRRVFKYRFQPLQRCSTQVVRPYAMFVGQQEKNSAGNNEWSLRPLGQLENAVRKPLGDSIRAKVTQFWHHDRMKGDTFTVCLPDTSTNNDSDRPPDEPPMLYKNRVELVLQRTKVTSVPLPEEGEVDIDLQHLLKVAGSVYRDISSVYMCHEVIWCEMLAVRVAISGVIYERAYTNAIIGYRVMELPIINTSTGTLGNAVTCSINNGLESVVRMEYPKRARGRGDAAGGRIDEFHLAWMTPDPEILFEPKKHEQEGGSRVRRHRDRAAKWEPSTTQVGHSVDRRESWERSVREEDIGESANFTASRLMSSARMSVGRHRDLPSLNTSSHVVDSGEFPMGLPLSGRPPPRHTLLHVPPRQSSENMDQTVIGHRRRLLTPISDHSGSSTITPPRSPFRCGESRAKRGRAV